MDTIIQNFATFMAALWHENAPESQAICENSQVTDWFLAQMTTNGKLCFLTEQTV